MAKRIQTPDGLVDFPDSMSDDEIKTVLRRKYAQINDPSANPNPTDGMSTTRKVLAGAGKQMTDLARGAGQMLGVVDDQTIEDAKRRDAPLMETGAGQIGAVAGGVAAGLPAMLIPGANTLTGGALIGAAEGLLQPTTEDDSRAYNAGVGAAGGFLGTAGGKALSRVLDPQTSDDALDLLDRGVELTPGQIAGGLGQRIESGMESIPFVGQGIKNAKIRANQTFNKAALNEALKPIGGFVDDIGHNGITQTRNLIGAAYDDALNLLPRVDFDPTFDQNIGQIRGMVSTLTPERQNQFNRIIDERLEAKLTPARSISGESFKAVESDIKRLAREYRGSADPDQRQMGDALNAVVAELHQVAGRNSPDAAAALKKADSAYARLLRLERAASMQGAPEGVFTPNQLGNAVRAMDNSLGHRSVAQGDALMQDLTTPARSVMGNTVPDSGTPERLMLAELLGGGALTGLASINVPAAVGAAGVRGMYTRPGIRAMGAAMTERPDMVRNLGGVAEAGSPLSGLLGVELMLQDE